MQNASGKITKLNINNGKAYFTLDSGMEFSCFNAASLNGAQQGSDVTFSYYTKDYNGKSYNNVGKSGVAVIGQASQQPTLQTSNTPAPIPISSHRNGQQVGASINQAIQWAGQNNITSLDQVEEFAKQFCKMSDRLSTYEPQ